MSKKQLSDVERSIAQLKAENPRLADEFEEGYRDFEIGVLLRQARIEAGFSQSQLAKKIHSQKTMISRVENHSPDVRLSTIRRVAKALGKHVELKLV